MSESTEQGNGPVEDAAVTEPVAETPETPAGTEPSESTTEPGPMESAATTEPVAPEAAVAPSETETPDATTPVSEPESPAAPPQPEPQAESPQPVVTAEPPTTDPDAAPQPEATTEPAETAQRDVTAEPDAAPQPEAVAEPAETPQAAGAAPADTSVSDKPAAEKPATDDKSSVETPAADSTPSTEVPSAEGTPSVDESAAPKPSAVPKPSAIPSPAAIARPRPPQAGAQGPAATQATPAPVPVVPAIDDSAAIAAAEKYGRVADDGTVYVIEQAGERTVGQFPGVDTTEALSLYIRRYLDLVAKVSLFETRLDSADLSVKEIDQTLTKLGEETTEPAAVGDLDELRSRVEGLRGRAAKRRSALEAERAAAKAEAVKAREAIVEAAEKIAATDPGKMQWRPAGEELRRLLDQWKSAQRGGPRIDRGTEEPLWKRFSHARTAFDRERRHFFADLEQRNKAAKTAKELLVSEAEALSDSTDWGYTSGAYRDLMTRWKAAGRASRKDDDALWAKFRAAQDRFFHSRDTANAELDVEYGENLKVKEAILADAEKLVPVKDLTSAKKALRGLQDRWDEAGKVPRRDIQRVENRMRAVETAIRDAEQDKWRRSNPETRARAEGAASQLESAITGLEADLEAARAKGNDRKVAELESSLAARRSWLEQVVKAAEDSKA